MRLTPAASDQPSDAGFTLVELLVSLVVIGLIVVPLGNAVVSILRNADVTNGRLSESHHVQITGRAKPDEGEVHYPTLMSHLDRLGFAGFVGAEYKPRGRTEDGLGWLSRWGAA